jgi:antitoxin ParD1/3/4
MADRQTRNVSLPPAQDAFVDAMVAGGRYRTVSEVVRDGLRLLEEAEHRRLLEKWLYEGLSADEEEQLPDRLKDRARAHFQGLVDAAMQRVENGRVSDGPTAMQRLREQLEARQD